MLMELVRVSLMLAALEIEAADDASSAADSTSKTAAVSACGASCSTTSADREKTSAKKCSGKQCSEKTRTGKNCSGKKCEGAGNEKTYATSLESSCDCCPCKDGEGACNGGDCCKCDGDEQCTDKACCKCDSSLTKVAADRTCKGGACAKRDCTSSDGTCEVARCTEGGPACKVAATSDNCKGSCTVEFTLGECPAATAILRGSSIVAALAEGLNPCNRTDGIVLGGVTPHIIIQEEEQERLGVVTEAPAAPCTSSCGSSCGSKSAQHTFPHDLLKQKLAERNRLQREIDELSAATQSWQQMSIDVQIVEINLTRLRELGITDRVAREMFKPGSSFVCNAPVDASLTLASYVEQSARNGDACSGESCCDGDAKTCCRDSAKSCRTSTTSTCKACPSKSGKSGDALASTVAADKHAVTLERSVDLASFLTTLDEKGVARTLMNPRLVVANGRPASFRVGGELPIPSGAGTPNACDYMSVGVELDLVAHSLGGNRVRMEIRPRISEASSERAIVVNGQEIPALSVTECDTGCELSLGDSAIVSGITQERQVSPWFEEGVQTEEVLMLVVVKPEAVSTAAQPRTIR